MTDHRPGRERVARRCIMLSLIAFAGVAALFLPTTPALAHASLITSQPADGSLVPSAPTHFVLMFSEPVSVTALRLVDAEGSGVDLTDPRAENESVTAAAPPIGNGTHALSWRVISADGHPVGGTIIFSVGQSSPSGIAVEAGGLTPVTALVWGTRLILYLAIFVCVGGMVFAAWTANGAPLPKLVGTTTAALGIVGLAAALTALGLQGLDMLGDDLPRLAGPAAWQEGLSSSYATTLALDGAGLALALISMLSAGKVWRRGLTAFALLLIGAAFAASGHVSTAPPQLLTRSAIFLHAISLTYWLGALLPLGTLLRYGDASAAAALGRFSRTAPVPVALIVVSGLVMAIIELESQSALWTTSYGFIFDAKIVAVLALLTLGAWNRYGLTRRTVTGEGLARRAIVRSIAGEMVLSVLILGLVASWRFTPPPRALASLAVAVPTPIRLHILGPRAMADLVIAPGHAGPSSVEIAVLDSHSGQLDSKGVTLTLSNPATGLEPMAREARHVSGANWIIDLENIPAPGQWTATVDVLISDFDEVTLEQTFELNP